MSAAVCLEPQQKKTAECCVKTNGVNIPGKQQLTLSVNPALARRRCGYTLALRGPSWIKASGSLAGCILGLAARLTRHFSALNTERKQAKLY